MATENQQNFNSIKLRILQLPELLNLTKRDFCKSIGIAQSNLNGGNLRSSPATDVIVAILKLYPQISVRWLILGEGNPTSPQRNAPVDIVSALRQTIAAQQRLIATLERQLSSFCDPQDSAPTKSKKVPKKYHPT